jgi:hypothetical protein
MKKWLPLQPQRKRRETEKATMFESQGFTQIESETSTSSGDRISSLKDWKQQHNKTQVIVLSEKH